MERRGKTPSYLPLVRHLRSAFDRISYASMSPRVLGLIAAIMIVMSEVILSRVMYYRKSGHIYTSTKVKCYTIPQLGLFASRCLLWGIRIKQGPGNTEDWKLRNCSSHLRCIKVEFHNRLWGEWVMGKFWSTVTKSAGCVQSVHQLPYLWLWASASHGMYESFPRTSNAEKCIE